MMYWFGAVLSPALTIIGIFLLITAFSGTHNHDGLAIAGAILLGSVLIVEKGKR